jgi:hypothetical protein
MQITLKYSDLKYSDAFKNNYECEVKLLRRFKTLQEYINYYIDNPQYLIVMLTFYYVIYSALKVIYYAVKFLYSSLSKLLLFILRKLGFKQEKFKLK